MGLNIDTIMEVTKIQRAIIYLLLIFVSGCSIILISKSTDVNVKDSTDVSIDSLQLNNKTKKNKDGEL